MAMVIGLAVVMMMATATLTVMDLVMVSAMAAEMVTVMAIVVAYGGTSHDE